MHSLRAHCGARVRTFHQTPTQAWNISVTNGYTEIVVAASCPGGVCTSSSIAPLTVAPSWLPLDYFTAALPTLSPFTEPAGVVVAELHRTAKTLDVTVSHGFTPGCGGVAVNAAVVATLSFPDGSSVGTTVSSGDRVRATLNTAQAQALFYGGGVVTVTVGGVRAAVGVLACDSSAAGGLGCNYSPTTTPTASSTVTPSRTTTRSVSPTKSDSWTSSATRSVSSSPTQSRSWTATASDSRTVTATKSTSLSASVSRSLSASVTPSRSTSMSYTPSRSTSASYTPSRTVSRSH